MLLDTIEKKIQELKNKKRLLQKIEKNLVMDVYFETAPATKLADNGEYIYPTFYLTDKKLLSNIKQLTKDTLIRDIKWLEKEIKDLVNSPEESGVTQKKL